MAKKTSKKTTTEETVVSTETPTCTGEALKAMLEKYTNVSLRKLAIACEISYNWVLKCSKEPIPNVPYNPTAVNYDKVASVFAKRGIDLIQLDWEALNVGAIRQGASLTKDMEAFQVGQKVYLREDNTTPFEICYKTETHIVIMKEGTTEPRSWSHATFLMKGPVFQPRTKTEKTTAKDKKEEEAITAEATTKEEGKEEA